MAEITSGQKRLIRKLITGEKLTYYSVGRDRTTIYNLSDGTSVKKETVQPLVTEGILKRINVVASSTGYGYQSRTAEYVLDEKYVRDFNKFMKRK